MALLITLFLVLVNIFNTITNISPNVEGMTAISMWMIACIFFVFGSLMAYATLLYFLLVRQIATHLLFGIAMLRKEIRGGQENPPLLLLC